MAHDPRRGGNAAAYEVGYGKPPERTRFRKGQSGNPAGRPKGALDLGTLLEKALSETVAVKDASGRRRRISKGEAAVTQLVNKAAAGADPRATRLLFDLLAKRRQARDGGAPAAWPGAAGPEEATAPAAPARPEPLIHWAGMTTAELVAVHEAIRIMEGHQREPRPADCPMPPAGPGGGGPDADDPPLRWYTPDPGDPSDAGEEGG
jgi:hypothetical protein